MHFFDEKLAHEIGLSEAIFLQNLYYLAKKYILSNMKSSKDDIWVKMSTSTIQKFQPYFTRSMIRTLTKNLLEGDLVKKVQLEKSTTNAFSYSLTGRGWILMMSLDDKTAEIKKIKTLAEEFNSSKISKSALEFLKSAEVLRKSEDPFSILSEELDSFTQSEKTLEEPTAVAEYSEKVVDQIIEVISENKAFKKRIEKTFYEITNFKFQYIIPAIERHGSFNVLEAIKKTSREFLPHISPVASFYSNLMELKL